MFAMSFVVVVAHVEHDIGIELFRDMLTWVQAHEPNLWGGKNPRYFLRDMLQLVLYHDIVGVGCQWLSALRDMPIKISAQAILTNTERLCAVLTEWSKKQLLVGDWRQWKTDAWHAGFLKEVKEVTLLIDPVNTPIERQKRQHGKKSDFWSYKLRCPGSHYTAITDMKWCVLLLSDGSTRQSSMTATSFSHTNNSSRRTLRVGCSQQMATMELGVSSPTPASVSPLEISKRRKIQMKISIPMRIVRNRKELTSKFIRPVCMWS